MAAAEFQESAHTCLVSNLNGYASLNVTGMRTQNQNDMLTLSIKSLNTLATLQNTLHSLGRQCLA